MKGLTKRQHELLTFIEEFIGTHHYSPSFREIMRHFGFTSLASVAKHISTLKRKGAITGAAHGKRSIATVSANKASQKSLEIELPYIGYISSNSLIETFPQSQTLAVPEFLVHNPETTYVLRARGSLLNDEMILDGDLLLVETRNDPHDGETIIFSTKQKSTAIRQYHPEGNYVRLTSRSPHTAPLMLRHEELLIHGIVVSVLRLY